MTEKAENTAKEKEYQRLLKEAETLMASGDMGGALASARKGHGLGLELREPAATALLLFCLNEAGAFDEARAAAMEYRSVSKEYSEAILSNTLCAMLAASPVDSAAGMDLLRSFSLDTADSWRKLITDFRFSPTQMALVFNAALIMAHDGKGDLARDILARTLSRMIHFIDQITGGERNLSEDEALNLAGILHLIMESPEFRDMQENEDFQELADIIEGCLE
jgi:hypothetical protein